MSKVIDLWRGMTGTVLPFAGSAAPAGWLLCYGQAVSRTDYAGLFAVIGTAFGTGDGSTTFNLPDLRGRVPAGKDDMGGSAANRLTNAASGINGVTLGAAGGAETHTLTTAQMPTHNHGVTDPGHAHTASFRLGTAGGGLTYAYGGTTDNANQAVTVVANTTGITVNDSGSGNAHPNAQPTLVLNSIIKT